uniref:Uncharacterized protein n=1 Tax=Pipistrellus kuhlii TaxID=59472 RepID=A0A7J7WDV4_PIPKU|nr:hypothetical protein mPipKuh1_008033 [Pipistrellus kuhlii]
MFIKYLRCAKPCPRLWGIAGSGLCLHSSRGQVRDEDVIAAPVRRGLRSLYRWQASSSRQVQQDSFNSKCLLCAEQDALCRGKQQRTGQVSTSPPTEQCSPSGPQSLHCQHSHAGVCREIKYIMMVESKQSEQGQLHSSPHKLHGLPFMTPGIPPQPP